MTVLWLPLIALGALVAWRVSVALFPWRTCPRCGGSRRIYGPGGHADCRRCKATGRVRRLGARRED